MEATPASEVVRDDDERLASLGYKPQLNRVLGFFSNFAVAFTYLSPMVGIYSLFILGVGTAGPAYIWLTFIPLIGMFFVALVFGELASHYPVAGALFQYSKFSVGPRFGCHHRMGQNTERCPRRAGPRGPARSVRELRTAGRTRPRRDGGGLPGRAGRRRA